MESMRLQPTDWSAHPHRAFHTACASPTPVRPLPETTSIPHFSNVRLVRPLFHHHRHRHACMTTVGTEQCAKIEKKRREKNQKKTPRGSADDEDDDVEVGGRTTANDENEKETVGSSSTGALKYRNRAIYLEFQSSRRKIYPRYR